MVRLKPTGKGIGKYSLLGNSNKRVILSSYIGLWTDLSEILEFSKGHSLNSHKLL